MVDPYVTKNAQKLTEFCLCCYRDYLPEGCVYAAVQKEGEKGLPEQRDRKLIMESVVHTISQASDTQYCHKNFELVHHILFDVEHMFDTIFGQHTSFNVYAGYGGREGLCVVVFGEKDLDTKVMSVTTMRRRMEKLHQFQLKLYTNNLEIRRAAGFYLDTENVLRDINTGAKFSIAHTEHDCCKGYYGIIHSLGSRTVSDTPRLFNNFSWPRPNPKAWDISLRETHQVMLNSWLKLEPEARAIPLFMVDENAAQLTHEEASLMRQAYQALGKGEEEEEQDDGLFENTDRLLIEITFRKYGRKTVKY
jgi:hypothetical protein